MKSKKLISLILLSLVLGGCGGNETPTTTVVNPTTDNPTTVTTVDPTTPDPTTPDPTTPEPVKTHTVTFKDGDTTVEVVTFEEGAISITEPTVPTKEGYTSAWETYELGTSDIVVNVVYTAITYTATFVADGETISTIEYTVENADTKVAPDVPSKAGHIGKWAPEVDFTILDNQTYEAVYEVDLKVKHGSFKYEDGKYIAASNDAIAIDPHVTFTSGTLSTNLVKSQGGEDSGIIFGVTYKGDELESYWEGDGVSYYFFFVSQSNCGYLAKSDNGVWKQLGRVESIWEYNEESEGGYPISVSMENGYIRCFVGETCVIKYQDSNALTGNAVGYRAQKQNTSYTPLTVTAEVKTDSRDVLDGATVAAGAVEATATGHKTTANGTVVVDNNIKMAEGKMYTASIKQGVKQDAGLIIGLRDEGYRSFWEEAWTSMEYYFFFINVDGILILSRVGSTTDQSVWNTVADNNNIKDNDPNKTYQLGVMIEGTVIKCYVDGMLVLTHDSGRTDLVGRMVGTRAATAGCEFSSYTVSDAPNSDDIEWYQRSGSWVKGTDGSLTTYCDGSLAWANNKALSKGSFEVDVTAENASDTGIVFGCSDPVGARWEEKPYYFFFVNGGNAALLAGPVNGWTTFQDGGNVSEYMNAYGTPNTFKVEILDNYQIKCYVNGHVVIDVTITDAAGQLSGTYFGVRAVGAGLRKFENFVITNA